MAMDEFNLTIIGCGSALPMHGRHPSAQVISYDDFHCLIDCGEGTQERLRPAKVKPFKISVILISHLHGDHVFGLPGLLSSMTHLGRTDKLTIFGPIGLKGFLDSIMEYTEMKVSYPIHIEEKSPQRKQQIFSNDRLEIFTFPLFHRIACNGYLLQERHQQLRFKKEVLHQYRLSTEEIHAVKRGESVVRNGMNVAAATFLHEPEESISYAYCSDTRFDHRLLQWIKGVSVLYHESTFLSDRADLADLTGHSTAAEAGLMAKSASAGCLITGHYSSRYKDADVLVSEAKENFGHVIGAEEGKKYNLRKLQKGTGH